MSFQEELIEKVYADFRGKIVGLNDSLSYLPEDRGGDRFKNQLRRFIGWYYDLPCVAPTGTSDYHHEGRFGFLIHSLDVAARAVHLYAEERKSRRNSTFEIDKYDEKIEYALAWAGMCHDAGRLTFFQVEVNDEKWDQFTEPLVDFLARHNTTEYHLETNKIMMTRCEHEFQSTIFLPLIAEPMDIKLMGEFYPECMEAIMCHHTKTREDERPVFRLLKEADRDSCIENESFSDHDLLAETGNVDPVKEYKRGKNEQAPAAEASKPSSHEAVEPAKPTEEATKENAQAAPAAQGKSLEAMMDNTPEFDPSELYDAPKEDEAPSEENDESVEHHEGFSIKKVEGSIGPDPERWMDILTIFARQAPKNCVHFNGRIWIENPKFMLNLHKYDKQTRILMMDEYVEDDFIPVINHLAEIKVLRRFKGKLLHKVKTNGQTSDYVCTYIEPDLDLIEKMDDPDAVIVNEGIDEV